LVLALGLVLRLRQEDLLALRLHRVVAALPGDLVAPEALAAEEAVATTTGEVREKLCCTKWFAAA